jgi:hypothetical protein
VTTATRRQGDCHKTKALAVIHGKSDFADRNYDDMPMTL